MVYGTKRYVTEWYFPQPCTPLKIFIFCILCVCATGTHARDFHSRLLTFFLYIFQYLVNTQHSIINILKNIFRIRPDFQKFVLLSVIA
jgi:hypothetical protein